MCILTLYGRNNVFMFSNNMFSFGRLFLCYPATQMLWEPYHIKHDWLAHMVQLSTSCATNVHITCILGLTWPVCCFDGSCHLLVTRKTIWSQSSFSVCCNFFEPFPHADEENPVLNEEWHKVLQVEWVNIWFCYWVLWTGVLGKNSESNQYVKKC